MFRAVTAVATALILVGCGSDGDIAIEPTTTTDESTAMVSSTEAAQSTAGAEPAGSEEASPGRDREPAAPSADDPLRAPELLGTLLVDGQEFGLASDHSVMMGRSSGVPELVIGFGDAAVSIELSVPDLEVTNRVTMVTETGLIWSDDSAEIEVIDGRLSGRGAFSSTDAADELPFELEHTFLAGSTDITIDGSIAELRGRIGWATIAQLDHLVENTDVDTLTLVNVIGSVDDLVHDDFGVVASLSANRAVAEALMRSGLAVEVPPEGQIWDGGIYFLAAAPDRTFVKGDPVGPSAIVGISSADLDPADNATQIAAIEDEAVYYYPTFVSDFHPVTAWQDILGVEQGTALYFFIQKKRVGETHQLTSAELELFGLADNGHLTEPLEAPGTSDFGAGQFLVRAETVGTQQFNRPGELVDAIVAAFNQDKDENDVEGSEWADTIMVFRPGGESIEDGEAVAYVRIRGMADDSAGGEVLTLELSGDVESGWWIEGATVRAMCHRGVSGQSCL